MVRKFNYVPELQPMVDQEMDRLKKLFETDDVISVGCSFVYLVSHEIVAKNNLYSKDFDETDYDPALSEDFAEFLGVRTAQNADRMKIRRQISEAAHEFYEAIGEVDTHLQYIAGEFMAANEEYVLNHSDERETLGTLDRLDAGFSRNQKKFLVRLRDRLQQQETVSIEANNAQKKTCDDAGT